VFRELKAIVIFDSRYGNTEKIAMDIANGLKQNQIEEVVCCRTTKVQVDKLRNYDLIAVGGPTEIHRASATMREFLSKLKHLDLRGKYGFAFDTKLNSRWAGEASNAIERTLKASGAVILMPRSSAFVISPPKEELRSAGVLTNETKEEQAVGKSEGWMEKEIRQSAAVLEEGMETKFEQIGLELGCALVQAQTLSH
jgi:flavorubredoxin